MTPEELLAFDEASNHPYECQCSKCEAWWDAVGPEPDDDDWEDTNVEDSYDR